MAVFVVSAENENKVTGVTIEWLYMEKLLMYDEICRSELDEYSTLRFLFNSKALIRKEFTVYNSWE